MNAHITREIIIDLLPLYEANELSAQSRQLVETYLAEDHELAKLIDKLGWKSAEISPIKPDHELATFNKARHLRYQFNAFFLLGTLFTLLWLVLVIVSTMQPLANGATAGIALFAVATGFWIGLGNVSRQLNNLD